MSYVKPIHKSGNNQGIINYRPIPKVSLIPKTSEPLIIKKFTFILSQHICNNLHILRPKMSISTNMLLHQFTILSALHKIKLNSIYTNLKKWFDKVNHNSPISKLKLFIFHDQLLNWVNSYLSNRTIAVQMSYYLSTDFKVTSNVP